MSDPTLNEIQAMLDELANANNGKVGFTTRELAAHRGITENQAKELLRPLIMSGQIKQVQALRYPADGYLGKCTVKAYVRA